MLMRSKMKGVRVGWGGVLLLFIVSFSGEFFIIWSTVLHTNILFFKDCKHNVTIKDLISYHSFRLSLKTTMKLLFVVHPQFRPPPATFDWYENPVLSVPVNTNTDGKKKGRKPVKK